MKSRRALVTVALACFASPPAARAQDEPGPSGDLQGRILERVERRLREDERSLRRDLQRILDEELGPAEELGPSTPLKEAPPPARPEDAPPSAKPDAAGPAAPAGPPAFLGVAVEALSDADREALDLADDEGVRVVNVHPGSPADRAGLQRGDVLLRVGRKRVGTPDELRRAVRAQKAGGPAALVLLRGKETRRAQAQFAPAPADAPQPPDKPSPPAPREGPRRPGSSRRGPGGDAAPEAGRPDAGPRARNPAAKGFDPDALLDDLLDGPAEKGNGLQDFFQKLRASPEGEAMLEFLREELRQSGPLLRQHAERGEDGRWRLRRDAGDFLRAWLEDEVNRHAKPGPDDAEKGAAKGPPAAPAFKVRVGVSVRALSAEERAARKLPEGAGFCVARLSPGGPAERAGLRAGDVVVKIDGQDASEPLLRSALSKAKGGDTLTLTVLRAQEDKAAAPEDVKVLLEAVK